MRGTFRCGDDDGIVACGFVCRDMVAQSVTFENGMCLGVSRILIDAADVAVQANFRPCLILHRLRCAEKTLSHHVLVDQFGVLKTGTAFIRVIANLGTFQDQIIIAVFIIAIGGSPDHFEEGDGDGAFILFIRKMIVSPPEHGHSGKRDQRSE